MYVRNCNNNMNLGVHTSANPSGGSSAALLQKQMSFKTSVGANNLARVDEIEVIETGHLDETSGKYSKNTLSWILCAPCIWIRTSTTVNKIALTTATLLVTSLLVSSPILFLISTAPSQLPHECFNDDDECVSTSIPPLECTAPICKRAAVNIQAKIDWNSDPCTQFKNFTCASHVDKVKANGLLSIRTARESVDIQMQFLLEHNTTSGPFRKLGRLYGSCLRQTTNSSTIKRILERLGGYFPMGVLGPSSIAPLISKMYELGPTPLLDLYYDLSYGKRPHVLLIISGPSTYSPILERKARWMGPKAPPYHFKHGKLKLLNSLMDNFLPAGLTFDQRAAEAESISNFIEELNKIRDEHTHRGFWDSTVVYNISSLEAMHPIFNWSLLIPNAWNGPIVIRNSNYFKAIQELLLKYPSRLAHNSLLLLFALEILPQDKPNPIVCTRSTMWALPELTSALFVAQHSGDDLKDVIKRTDEVFKALKAHLKRAPSLKGAALVKLSALKIQSRPWSGFTNFTTLFKTLELLEINSDNWFENILNIYQRNKFVPDIIDVKIKSHDTWAYPIISKVFYDTLSHSIVVPLSVILVPYFDGRLPPYLHYASVGVAIAKEILRSITKSFEEKALQCVPRSINVFSNYGRMDILIHSGGMQIAYHSLLSLTGPLKGMARLSGLNLSPTQIYFLVSAQELCSEADYTGIDTESSEFENILGWLIAQGGSATDVFKCPAGSMIHSQKTCNIL